MCLESSLCGSAARVPAAGGRQSGTRETRVKPQLPRSGAGVGGGGGGGGGGGQTPVTAITEPSAHVWVAGGGGGGAIGGGGGGGDAARSPPKLIRTPAEYRA